MEPSSGFILVDDINIRQLGLQELRSKITIIPKNPNLFTGSLRANLDPLGMFDDDKLISVLKQVKLLEIFQGHPRNLLEVQVCNKYDLKMQFLRVQDF